MSRIVIVTPANRDRRSGNRVTADRWAGMFRRLGHQVQVTVEFTGQRCDLLIALHARRSAAAVTAIRQQFPGTPVVVVLTGTDLYGNLGSAPQEMYSLQQANRLIVLQECGVHVVPQQWQSKVRVIYQSATSPVNPPAPLSRVFEVCVSGHLRPVKDPFRAELASRSLPDTSAIRITHIGAALSEPMRRRAVAASESNRRYRWLGPQPRWKARRLQARSQVLVVSSKMEGGANVISESLSASVPVLASRISGNIGMLGDDYAGYFDVGHTAELTALMSRFETDAQFRRLLRRQCRKRSGMFAPAKESAALKQLLSELDVA